MRNICLTITHIPRMIATLYGCGDTAPKTKPAEGVSSIRGGTRDQP
jgi:hypothetical protein